MYMASLTSTKIIFTKVQTFMNHYLRKILKMYRPDTISNTDLWERTHQPRVETEIQKGDGAETNTTRQALSWNPEEKRKGPPKKHLAKGPQGRHQEDGLQLERASEDRPGQRALENCSLRPIHVPLRGHGHKSVRQSVSQPVSQSVCLSVSPSHISCRPRVIRVGRRVFGALGNLSISAPPPYNSGSYCNIFVNPNLIPIFTL